MEKVYVGDAVYASFEFWSGGVAVTLTTEDGIRVTNSIVLEPEILISLERFIAAAREEWARLKEAKKQ